MNLLHVTFFRCDQITWNYDVERILVNEVVRNVDLLNNPVLYESLFSHLFFDFYYNFTF